MRTLIFGGSGQLGHDLLATHPGVVLSPDHRWCDVRDRDNVRRWMENAEPDVVVNAAAFHDVAACEDDIEQAFDVNALGAYNVAAEAAVFGAPCVYISTDYVFDGLVGNYVEDDPTWPCNVYGASKAAGEILVREANPNAYIIRTQALYGRTPPSGKPGGNFPSRILFRARRGDHIEVVDDQYTCPTWTHDLATRVWELTALGRPGVYHVANSGVTSWYGLAKEVCAIWDIDADIVPVMTQPGGVPRPAAAMLTDTQMALQGLTPMRGWREALRGYFT